MSLAIVFALLLTAFLALQLRILPSLEKRLALRGGKRALIKRASFLLAFFVRNALLVMTLTVGSSLLILLVLDRTGGSTIDELSGAVERARGCRLLLSGFGTVAGSTVCLLLAAGMMVASYLLHRVQMVAPQNSQQQRIRSEELMQEKRTFRQKCALERPSSQNIAYRFAWSVSL